MKIIGIAGYYNAEPTRFIVEITATELNELVNRSNAHRQASVGSEVKIHDMFKKLQWLDANAKSIELVVRKLRETADMLEPEGIFTKYFCEGGK